MRLRATLLAGFVGLAALLITTGALGAGASLTATNVSCSSAGYAFTATGTGLPANATLILWVFDNLNPPPPPSGQPDVVTTDATGSFSVNFTGGPAQTLPAQIEVTDLAFNLLAGPQTVSAVACTPPPIPDLSVTKTTTATTVGVGDSITYSVSVSNVGVGPAHHVRLSDLLFGPGTVTSMSSVGSTLCETAPSCALGTLDPGETATVTVVVATNGPGTVQNTATATTTDAEANVSNNTGAAPPVTVFAAPPPAGCGIPVSVSGDGRYANDHGNNGIRVQFDAECGYDKKTGTFTVTKAKLKIQQDGGPPLLDAKTNGSRNYVASMSVVGTDATITGSFNGMPFVVTLHDGGPAGNQFDTMQVVWGTFTTAPSPPTSVDTSVDYS
jgi:uncharacterized repeat protein (TIGR01451 family)